MPGGPSILWPSSRGSRPPKDFAGGLAFIVGNIMFGSDRVIEADDESTDVEQEETSLGVWKESRAAAY